MIDGGVDRPNGLLLVGAAPAFADEAPTYKEQMTNLWASTGDAGFARLAGLSDQQISAARQLPAETVTLGDLTSSD